MATYKIWFVDENEIQRITFRKNFKDEFDIFIVEAEKYEKGANYGAKAKGNGRNGNQNIKKMKNEPEEPKAEKVEKVDEVTKVEKTETPKAVETASILPHTNANESHGGVLLSAMAGLASLGLAFGISKKGKKPN